MERTLDAKGRWRNRTVGFRVSEEEAKMIDRMVALSGFSKQEYILRKLMDWEVTVQGNPRVYKALKNQMQQIYGELKRLEVCSEENEELLQTIQMVAVTLNGMKEEPDRVELRLSDAFLCQNPEENGCLECRATMININYGHNEELMDRCKRLKDYAVFVNRIRENERRGMALNEAVELAVNSCINEGILADILKKNRAEVCNLILYEYDEQKQLAIAREGAKKAGREEGREEGREQGIAQGREAEKVMVIRNMAAKGLDPRSIADMLNTEEPYIKNVLNLLAEKVGKTDLEIAGILLNRNKTGKNP